MGLNEYLKQFYRMRRIYRCRICGEAFETLFSIEQHLKQIHTERIKKDW